MDYSGGSEMKTGDPRKLAGAPFGAPENHL